MTSAIIVGGAGGNLASVRFALERLGAEVRVSDDRDEIAAAERLILPGVGAAAFAMSRLAALGLTETLRTFPRPLLGICLGQQLLFEGSDEGSVDLLGLVPGRVRALDPGDGRPVPHMGWSRLRLDRTDPLLDGIRTGDWAYFVHSFVCPDGPHTLAHADYGRPIPAMVRSANRWGCQFHPERSAETGARILRNFLELKT